MIKSMSEISVKFNIRIELEGKLAEDFEFIKDHLGIKHNSEVIRHLIKFRKAAIEREKKKENNMLMELIKDRTTKEERAPPKPPKPDE